MLFSILIVTLAVLMVSLPYTSSFSYSGHRIARGRHALKATIEENTEAATGGKGSRKGRSDISALEGIDVKSTFKATVSSSHDFGIFAKLEDFNVEGLVPASKLGAAKLTKGQEVEVRIVELDIPKKKLVLALKAGNRAEVGSLANYDSSRWLQGIIQSVSNFGLFVRPAGVEAVGLVHRTQVPSQLVAALKQQVDAPPTGQNKTDVEHLFSAGDVVKVRIKSVAEDSNKISLTMLPFKDGANQDDGYVVDGRDPEGEEFKSYEVDDDDDALSYDAQDTLLWWRGQPYNKVILNGEAKAVDEEEEIITENSDLVEGIWRRMFELDLRADQADFSSKVLDREEAELKEDIGELIGLDEDLETTLASGNKAFGSFVSSSLVPSEWRDQMNFYRETTEMESEISSSLRGGKNSDQSEFEALLKEVEAELASAPGGRRLPVTEEGIEAAVEEAVNQDAPAAAATTTTEEAVAEEETPAAE